jgi:hypothetical protein
MHKVLGSTGSSKEKERRVREKEGGREGRKKERKKGRESQLNVV